MARGDSIAIRDVLTAKGLIRNPQGRIKWALEKIGNFRYRERFHLSYRQFMEEPYEEFVTNVEIMKVEGEIEKARMRSTERKGKI